MVKDIVAQTQNVLSAILLKTQKETKITKVKDIGSLVMSVMSHSGNQLSKGFSFLKDS